MVHWNVYSRKNPVWRFTLVFHPRDVRQGVHWIWYITPWIYPRSYARCIAFRWIFSRTMGFFCPRSTRPNDFRRQPSRIQERSRSTMRNKNTEAAVLSARGKSRGAPLLAGTLSRGLMPGESDHPVLIALCLNCRWNCRWLPATNTGPVTSRHCLRGAIPPGSQSLV